MIGLLEASDVVRERIIAQCPAVKHAFVTEDIAAVKEASQKHPAAHVVHGGYRPLSEAGAGRRWREDILVVVVVKNVTQGDEPGRRQAAAAPMVREILAALDGWRVAGAIKDMAAIPGPAPMATTAFSYYPLLFSHEVITEGFTGD